MKYVLMLLAVVAVVVCIRIPAHWRGVLIGPLLIRTMYLRVALLVAAVLCLIPLVKRYASYHS
jgi:hypothetical protein